MNLEARLAPSGDAGLLSGYSRTDSGAYDELIDEIGNLRPHWLPFLAALALLPPDERAQRAERLRFGEGRS